MEKTAGFAGYPPIRLLTRIIRMKTPASAKSSSICMNPPKAKSRLKSHKANRITASIQSMVILHSNSRRLSLSRFRAAVQNILSIFSQGAPQDNSR
jgi:hypothetical protein